MKRFIPYAAALSLATSACGTKTPPKSPDEAYEQRQENKECIEIRTYPRYLRLPFDTRITAIAEADAERGTYLTIESYQGLDKIRSSGENITEGDNRVYSDITIRFPVDLRIVAKLFEGGPEGRVECQKRKTVSVNF